MFYRQNEIIRDGILVATSDSSQLSADQIISQLLNSDDEIRTFCVQNGVSIKNRHIYATDVN